MKKRIIVLGLLFPVFLAGCGAAMSSSLPDSSSSEDSSSISSIESSSADISGDSSSEESTQSSASSSKESSVLSSSSEVSSQTSSIPDYVLHGQFHGDSDWTDKAMKANESAAGEYMIQGVKLYENDVFKVHMAGDTWYGYSALKRSVPSGLVGKGSSDDNIKVLVTGIYDLYSSYNESDYGHIYLARTDGGGGSSSSSAVSVTGIELDRTGKYLQVRYEFRLTATVYPSNATNKEIRWSSSDTSVATVSTAGRVTGVSKGSAIITAKTVDGSKTATCLVYVSPKAIPEYYLTGTIHGRDYGYGQYTYAAIPLSTGRYLIPDLDLLEGDELKVMGDNGATLKNKYNQTYVYEIRKGIRANAKLNVNDENKNYLTLEEK